MKIKIEQNKIDIDYLNSEPDFLILNTFRALRIALKVAILSSIQPNKKAVQKRVQNLHSLTDLKQVQNPLISVPY